MPAAWLQGERTADLRNLVLLRSCFRCAQAGACLCGRPLAALHERGAL